MVSQCWNISGFEIQDVSEHVGFTALSSLASLSLPQPLTYLQIFFSSFLSPSFFLFMCKWF